MSLRSRILYVIIAITLLPLNIVLPARASEPAWLGTINVQRVIRTYESYWGSLNGENIPLSSRTHEFYERKIIGVPTAGGFAETIKYTYYKERQEVCGLYPNQYVSYRYITANSTVTVGPQPHVVTLANGYASISGPWPTITAVFLIQPACDGEPYEDDNFISLHPAPLTDEDISAGSEELLGYEESSSQTSISGVNQTWTDVTVWDLTKEELDTPWLSPGAKDTFGDIGLNLGRVSTTVFLAGLAACATGVGCAIGGPVDVVAGIGGALGQGASELANDPGDPIYTEIEEPVTPTTSQHPIPAGGDLTQAQADALNALDEQMLVGIGLNRALLTAFDRASGAQAANDSYWVEQQLQAARTWAGQLADILETMPQLLENISEALQTYPGLPFDILSEHEADYKYELITGGLSPSHQELLDELGVSARDQEKILHQMILSELLPEESLDGTIASFPGLFTDPDLNASIEAAVIALQEFSAGEGWKLYIPLVLK